MDSAVFSEVLFGDMQETMSSKTTPTGLVAFGKAGSGSAHGSHVCFLKFGLGQAPALSAHLTPSSTHLKYTVVTPVSSGCKTGFFQQGVMILDWQALPLPRK